VAAKNSVAVFIGWSGPRSKAVALAFKEWLPLVIQAAIPWVSEDIDRGAPWFTTIGTHLTEAHYGLLCVTPENVTEPWVLFEAGALALRTGEGLACPYLLDMTPAALAGPLAQLQAATANRDGTWRVVETVNRLLDAEAQLPAERLRKAFDKWWSELEGRLAEARQVAAAPAQVPDRSADDKLDELLEIARAQQRSEGRVFDTTTAFLPLGGGAPQVFTNLGLSPAPKIGDMPVRGLLTYLPPAPPSEPAPTKPSRPSLRAKLGKPKKAPPP
jgi:hypothetical protein